MKRDFSINILIGFAATVICLGLTTGSALAAQNDLDGARQDNPSQSYCSHTAELVHGACQAEVLDVLGIAAASCINISDRQERDDCLEAADEEREEAMAFCRQQRRARLNVCNLVGQDRYDPQIDPANFVDPLTIGQGVQANPYFPLVPGTEWVYEATSLDDEGEEVTETITVTVTQDTKLIEGVTCIVVNDVVMEDGQVIEDTDDWYAQDVAGNVWYFGEVARNFESFEGDDPEEPELVDLEGSWKAGRDNAKPGILIPFSPQEGDVIRQEMALGQAEDLVEIVSLTGTETAPAADCDGDCLVTKDFSPLEPGISEQEYYAPGVGLILELDADGERGPELVSFTQP
ncbi:MAG: hypothetical protein R6W92_12630 [Desulfocurvibacter africanus]